jgi:hypothetical protein
VTAGATTMSRLEIVDGTTWRDFVAAPRAVLILAKTNCQHCADWSMELGAFLDTDMRFSDVRFGKMYLDKPGLADFKRGNTWLAEVDDLPFNLLYVKGERRKSWPGGGVGRLLSRLEETPASPPTG